MAKDFNIILFDKFETLDAFGPAEIMGRAPEGHYQVKCFSMEGGLITSDQNIVADTLPINQIDPFGIVLIPGGIGVRSFIEDDTFMVKLGEIVDQAEYVLTVCNATAFLAKTDFLNGRKATTNKMRFDWVTEFNSEIDWQRCARWTVDGKFYTSSGVTAGMDMTLGFLADRHGEEFAEDIATFIEYIWNRDPGSDPFAV